jgi:hypothetical protein
MYTWMYFFVYTVFYMAMRFLFLFSNDSLPIIIASSMIFWDEK